MANIKLKKGFTLIELMVVMVIIGILAGLVFLGFYSWRAKARDAKRIAELEQVQTAINLYILKYGSPPPRDHIYAAAGSDNLGLAGLWSIVRAQEAEPDPLPEGPPAGELAEPEPEPAEPGPCADYFADGCVKCTGDADWNYVGFVITGDMYCESRGSACVAVASDVDDKCDNPGGGESEDEELLAFINEGFVKEYLKASHNLGEDPKYTGGDKEYPRFHYRVVGRTYVIGAQLEIGRNSPKTCPSHWIEAGINYCLGN